METFLAFLGLSIIVIVTPGPDTAITIRNTLLGGRAGGILTAFGIACGQIIWAFATSAGIVALLIACEPLFLAIKYAGAIYLIYLGAHALWEAVRPSTAKFTTAANDIGPRLHLRAAFRQGIISDLGNPKMAVFFASLLPQFTPAVGATFADFLFLGGIFAAMTFTWLTLYAVFISRLSHVLNRPTIRRSIEACTGFLLISLGLRVAAEQR